MRNIMDLFVRLTWLVWRYTWVLMGPVWPDWNKYSSQVKKLPSGLWKCKEIETDLRIKAIKEKKIAATPNKSRWTILLQAFGTRERRFLIQSQVPLNNLLACKDCQKSDFEFINDVLP